MSNAQAPMKTENDDEVLSATVAGFAIDGKLEEIQLLKKGHIHNTYISRWNIAGEQQRFVHQRLNEYVFPDIPLLMENMEQVLSTLKRSMMSGGNKHREKALSLVKTRAGKSYLRTVSHEYWRTFPFLEDTMNFELCPGLAQAQEVGAICGRFIHHLSSLDPRGLKEPIPGFFNGRQRFQQFEKALQNNAAGRRDNCREETDFIEKHASLLTRIEDALQNEEVPLRVIHGDTKLNNVLFDSKGERAVALVDLDTCMPGSLLFDYGDLLRNTSVPAKEDEADLSKVRVDQQLYDAVHQGYMSGVGDVITEGEKSLLSESPKVLALMLGSRFLADYLNGDKYFHCSFEDQNLRRARTQLQIVRELL